jgi:hypothetical protein
MNFLKAITPTIRKVVSIPVQGGNAQEITLVWKRPNDDERLALMQEINVLSEKIGSADNALKQSEATKEFVESSRQRITEYLTDWDFKDDGMNVEFSKENLCQCLAWSEYRRPFDESLMSVLMQSSEDARLGNSLSADSTSPAPTTVEK